MRILHITNHAMEIGNGIVNVAVDLACTQSDSGHQVFYASNGGEYENLLNFHGVQHHQIKLRKSLFGLPQLWVDFRRIIRATRPDIVHAHMMTGAIIGKISRPGFGYKLVTHVHNEFQRSARLMGVGDAVIAVSEAVSVSMQNRGIPALRYHEYHTVYRHGHIPSGSAGRCVYLWANPFPIVSHNSFFTNNFCFIQKALRHRRQGLPNYGAALV